MLIRAVLRTKTPFSPLGRRNLSSSSYSFTTRVPFVDKASQHKALVHVKGRGQPSVGAGAFVAPSATVTGNVSLFENSSVWYGAVVRGDYRGVRIGHYANIQDNAVVSDAPVRVSEDNDGSTVVGHFVSVGHGCYLHATTVEDKCIIGMGSTLCENSYMETESMLGAGSVLFPDSRVRTHELWLGNPAQFVRHLTEDEVDYLEFTAQKYGVIAYLHSLEFEGVDTSFRDAERLRLWKDLGWEGSSFHKKQLDDAAFRAMRAKFSQGSKFDMDNLKQWLSEQYKVKFG